MYKSNFQRVIFKLAYILNDDNVIENHNIEDFFTKKKQIQNIVNLIPNLKIPVSEFSDWFRDIFTDFFEWSNMIVSNKVGD